MRARHQGFTLVESINAARTVWTPPNAGNCSVTYDPSNGSVAVNGTTSGGQLTSCQ